MPKYWFTTFEGPAEEWDPQVHDYTLLYNMQIIAMRERFQLEKVERGVYAGTGYIFHTTTGVGPVLIRVVNFKFGEKGYWVPGSGSEPKPISPIMRAHTRIAILTKSGEWRVIFDDEVVLTFPASYPHRFSESMAASGRPYIQVTPHLWNGPSNAGLSNGGLCLLWGDGDWDPEKHTVVRAIEAVAYWAANHSKNGRFARSADWPELEMQEYYEGREVIWPGKLKEALASIGQMVSSGLQS